MRFGILAMALAVGLAAPVLAGDTPSNPDARVYITNLSDGDTVSGPVTVRFGLVGMGIAPAGVEWDNTGHHHLIVDRAPYGAEAGDNMDDPIPGDENHRHFGGGQTETTLDLPAGTHTLQLVLGDAFHVPHDPPIMSEVITITVD
ncbi:MAG: DUF4399 domain-containing protein [Rhodobacteraceae bacterium]|nr:DUF4399 domain-containing protein [Paracoccaceae bacterium]